MNIYKTFLVGLVLPLCCLSSCAEKDVFEESPIQRTNARITQLRNELTQAPHGWLITYFPTTDSLLFANASATFAKYYWEDFGKGGFTLQAQFRDDGTVTMRADYDAHSINTPKESQYEIKQTASTMLSFTTYTYVHQMSSLGTASDLLYLGKTPEGKLCFGTPQTLERSKEYIVFEKITTSQDTTPAIANAYYHRKAYEQMKNPQLRIYQGGRTFFQSDYHLKFSSELSDVGQEILNYGIAQRYWLFLYDKSLGFGKSFNGLGSGYTGTPEGMTLYPGIRMDAYVFHDFEYVGDRFVCHLVKVYDAYNRTFRYESKHLALPGTYEDLGITAEIWDAKTLDE